MIEITGIAMGLMMTGVAVMAGGLMLEATLVVMSRVLRAPLIVITEPPSIELA